MEQDIVIADLILPILGLMLSSSVITALLTSYLNRRKILGEALEATGGGVYKIVNSSIDLVEEYRKDFEEKTQRISELEKEIRLLNKRLDEEVEKRLQAEAFGKVLEQQSIERGKQINTLETQIAELQAKVLVT